MTVLTPSRETELDAFDLDLRVVPGDTPQDPNSLASGPDTTWGCPTGTGMCPSAPGGC